MKRAASPHGTDQHDINNNLLPPNKKVGTVSPSSSTTKDLVGEQEEEQVTKVSAVVETSNTSSTSTTSSATRPKVAILRAASVEKEITAEASVVLLERNSASTSCTAEVQGRGGQEEEVYIASDSDIVLENPSCRTTSASTISGSTKKLTCKKTKSYKEFMDIAKSDYFSIDEECGMWVDCSVYT